MVLYFLSLSSSGRTLLEMVDKKGWQISFQMSAEFLAGHISVYIKKKIVDQYLKMCRLLLFANLLFLLVVPRYTM